MDSSANKIISNTGILYLRMGIGIITAFYTTKLLLATLGSSSYGCFMLIISIILTASFINNGLAITTHRFLSFHLGKKNITLQKKIFNNCILLHVGVAILTFIILEIGSFFLFDGFLKIQENLIYEAKLIFHILAVSSFFSIVSVPFVACIISHEHIFFMSLVQIIESIIRLVVAIALIYFFENKLVTYVFLISLFPLLSLVAYTIYAHKNFDEFNVRARFSFDPKIIKEITTFTGWNLFGSFCGILREEGINVILNVFLGTTTVNAAYGISTQVKNQVSNLSHNLLKSFNPQIMKNAGGNDFEKMLKLTFSASKIGFFIVSMVAVPIIYEIKPILHFWLGTYPKYAPEICNLVLLSVILNQLTAGIPSAIQAKGQIRMYQISIGVLMLTNPIIAYLLLRYQYNPIFVFSSFAIIELIGCFIRVYIANKVLSLSIKGFLYNVVLKEVTPMCLLISICFLCVHFFNFKYRFLMTLFLSTCFYSLGIYLFGITKTEKETIRGYIYNLSIKLF